MNQNILDFGAVSDGQTLCTAAIQKAIDTCASTGGGYVYVPQGRFVSGTIALRSNVYLYLCPGAYLLGSIALADYTGVERGCAWGGAVAHQLDNLQNACRSLIVAENEENCGILGDGEIDGQRSKENAGNPEVGRPFLVVFSRCRGVKVEGVTLRNPGQFTVYMLACTDVTISRVKIYSTDTACGDGLDFDGGRNVTISDCIVYAGDDAISIKALTPSEPCENFMIQNCYLHAKYWGCIRIGPESGADMRHITVTNCVFEDSNDGLKVQLCESSVYEYFTFSNITMDGVVRPFFFTNSSYSMSANDKSIRPTGGIMRYINVDNVTARMIQRPKSPDPTDSSLLHLSCNYIYSLPECTTHDIKFSNVHITCVGGGAEEENSRADHGEMVDYAEFYPEICKEVGVYPAAAMYVKNCDRITLDNFSIEALDYDARPAIAAEAVNDLYCHHVTTRNTAYLLRQISCTEVELNHCKGGELPISAELTTAWEANRQENLAILAHAQEMAALADSLKGKPVVMESADCAAAFTSDGQGRYFFYAPWLKGNFDLLINGEKIETYRLPKKYHYLSVYVKEITDFIKADSNQVELVLQSDDARLAEPMQIIQI